MRFGQMFQLRNLYNQSGQTVSLGSETELATLLSGLRTSNGSWKITRPGRHFAANEFLMECLHREGEEISVIADIGVSSGITTEELVRDLIASGHPVASVLAIDRGFQSYLVKLSKWSYALVDEEKFILRLESGPLNFAPWLSRRDRWTGVAALKRIFASRAERRLDLLSTDEILSPPHSAKHPAKALLMVSPSLRQRHGVQFLEHDLLTSFDHIPPVKADLVRAACLLNTDRLTEQDIIKMVSNIRSIVSANGFLFVCWSTRTVSKASVFRFKGDHLRHIGSKGGGVDAEPILRKMVFNR